MNTAIKRKLFTRRGFIGSDAVDEALYDLENALSKLQVATQEGRKLQNQVKQWHKLDERKRYALAGRVFDWLADNSDEFDWQEYADDLNDALDNPNLIIDRDEEREITKVFDRFNRALDAFGTVRLGFVQGVMAREMEYVYGDWIVD